jgi:hypothetical protein
MVAAVHQCDLDRRAGQTEGGFQAAKPGADDHHAMGCLRRAGHGHATSVSDGSVHPIMYSFPRPVQGRFANRPIAETYRQRLRAGAAKPDGVRYVTLRLEDDTFIHFVEAAADDGTGALAKLAAFQAFQGGILDRCVEPPQVRGVTIVGNYRMLGEP